MGSKDKRKHFRVNSLNLSYVFVNGDDDEEKQTIGRTLNVSESGILLETYIPVNLNDKLLLTIGLKEDLVNIEGKVVHIAKAYLTAAIQKADNLHIGNGHGPTNHSQGIVVDVDLDTVEVKD